MDKRHVIEALRAHEPELKAAGIVHLRLFGSVVRGESSQASDVDLMADLDPSKRFTLISMVHLENHLADILGVKVDLSPANCLKEQVYKHAIRESVLAF